MPEHFSRWLWTASLVAMSLPAAAQYVSTSPPQEPPAAASTPGPDGLQILPKNGQNEKQQWTDRYECHRWATTQSGFDPTAPGAGGQAPPDPTGQDHYRRALTACLEGRGYAVSQAPMLPVSPLPTPPASRSDVRFRSAEAQPSWHPLSVRIDGGYTIAAGATDRYLDDGYNIGFGVSLFPSPNLPVGLRVDGSYSSFRGRWGLLDQYPGDFNRARRNIYGGDLDLQFNLTPLSSFSRLYLIGGAGVYREQTRLRQVGYGGGFFCGYFGCGPGFGPVLTDADRETTSWRSAWNAGLGWELTNPGGPSFFVEARYLSIAPHGSQTQFLPIRVGLRF